MSKPPEERCDHCCTMFTEGWMHRVGTYEGKPLVELYCSMACLKARRQRTDSATVRMEDE